MKYFSYIKEIGLLLVIPLVLTLIDPFSIGFVFGYLLAVIILFFYKKEFFELMDKTFVILLLFSVIYTLFNALGENKGVQYLIIQVVFPPILYIIGKILIHKKLQQNQVVTLMTIIGIIYSFSSVVSILLDLNTGGYAQTDRTIASFWNGRGILATGMAGYLIFNLTLPPIIISNKSGFKLLTKAALIIVYVLSMLCAFRLGSRTLIALTAISIVFGILYQLFTLDFLGKLKFLVQLVVVTLLLAKFAPIDLEADYLSTLGQRLQDSNASSASSAGGRTELWAEAVGNLFRKPLGWQSTHFSHNLWLDTAKIGGVLSFLLLIFFNMINLFSLKKLIFSKNIILPLKMTAALFTIIAFVFFFVEPILEGNFFTFTTFCLFQGMISRILTTHGALDKKSEIATNFATT